MYINLYTCWIDKNKFQRLLYIEAKSQTEDIAHMELTCQCAYKINGELLQKYSFVCWLYSILVALPPSLKSHLTGNSVWNEANI